MTGLEPGTYSKFRVREGRPIGLIVWLGGSASLLVDEQELDKRNNPAQGDV